MWIRRAPYVLVLDDDPALAEVLHAALSERGYHVTCDRSLDLDSVRMKFDRDRPDCVLLDGQGAPLGFGRSWEVASWFATLSPPVPVIMLTSHTEAVAEARAAISARAAGVAFAAAIAKPFEVGELLLAIERAIAKPHKPRPPA